MRAEAQRKQEMIKKIRKADITVKDFFQLIKSMLEKAGEELILPPLPATVDNALRALEGKKLIQLLYNCFDAKVNGNQLTLVNIPAVKVNMNKFRDFIQFYLPKLKDEIATEVFLNLQKKLTANVKPQAEEPKTIGKSNRDLMGMDKTNIYGFTDMEMRSMELDLDVL